MPAILNALADSECPIQMIDKKFAATAQNLSGKNFVISIAAITLRRDQSPTTQRPCFRTSANITNGGKSIASRLLVVWALASMPIWYCPSARGNDAAAVQSLPQIAAGTRVGVSDTGRWNRVVLLAKPRLASGDWSQLSEAVRAASTAFSLTILATVQPYSATDGSKRYSLAEVGVGYSVPINGVQTIISYQTAAAQGADPGFIGRQVLAANEEQLDKAVIIVRSSTLLVFDTPGIMLRQGEHRDYIIRHLVWIDPKTGRGATAIWLLEKGVNGRLQPANEPLRLVATGTQEDRKIHVDGEEFFLGIPSERAFAIESPPPGASIAWTPALTKVAALPKYTAQTLGDLSTALNHAIEASRSGGSANAP